MMVGAQLSESDNDPVAERDYFRRLLKLTGAEEPEPLLEQALRLIVDMTRAQMAYLELSDRSHGAEPLYWRAHGCSAEDVATIRGSASRGIIGRAIAQNRTIVTPSAVSDPEFRDQPSVLRHAIKAVVCAPIGRPPIGAVYLQHEHESAQFIERNREMIELFAQQLGAVADRVLMRTMDRVDVDATREIRTQFRSEGIVGRSRALARVLREAAQVAPLTISVLLTGAPGTGKTALARAIHANSARPAGPYLDINCAALPENLIESELFGVEPGAFTGATRRLAGKVATARGGTLFLDEIGELPVAAQGKLLQLLQERRYYPVGAAAPVVADVRVISATNADLKARVAARQFREDLYYRLAVLPIALPTLDERREDIAELAERFCEEACARNAIAPLSLTRRAVMACCEALWPGNIRELANAIEAAVARASFEKSSNVDEHHVFPHRPAATAAVPTYRDATQRFQRRYVEEALVRNGWNIKKTSVELDLSRQHLHDLIASFGLQRP